MCANSIPRGFRPRLLGRGILVVGSLIAVGGSPGIYNPPVYFRKRLTLFPKNPTVPREIHIDQMIEVRLITNPLAAAVSDKPFPAGLLLKTAQEPTQNILHPQLRLRKIDELRPAHHQMDMGGISAHRVRSPSAAGTYVVDSDDQDFLHLRVEFDTGMCLGVITKVCLNWVWGKNAFAALDVSAGVVRPPGSMGVPGEMVDGHMGEGYPGLPPTAIRYEASLLLHSVFESS